MEGILTEGGSRPVKEICCTGCEQGLVACSCAWRSVTLLSDLPAPGECDQPLFSMLPLEAALPAPRISLISLCEWLPFSSSK